MDCADRYGAWFLATMESLRGTDRIREDARSHPNRKPSLTAGFALAAAYWGCSGFRRLVSAFGGVLETLHALPSHWPSAAWIE